MPRRALLAVLALHLSVTFWFLANPEVSAAWSGVPLDDAWIHLVYGRAFLETGLPAYNPGQLETGFSSPAQAVVAALAHVIAMSGIPVTLALKGLGVVASCAAVVLAGELACALGGPGWVAAGLLALSPTWAFSAVSGMEITLAGALQLAACLARARGRDGLAGLALAGAVLARPESVLLLGVVPLLKGPRAERRLLPTFALLVGPALVALGLWSAACIAISGLPLPATIYAKALPLDLSRIPVAFAGLFDSLPAVTVGAGPLLAVLAVALPRDRRTIGLLAAVPVLWIAALASRTLVGGDPRSFCFLRYLLPTEALFTVVMALGARAAAPRLRGLGLGLVALVAVAYGWDLPVRRLQYAMNCLNIEEMNVALAGWIDANTPPDAVVATVDAGAVRYLGGRRTLDVIGLNLYEILPDRTRVLSDPAEMSGWMSERGADWLVIFPKVFPLTQLQAHPEGWFSVAVGVTSPHYTVASPLQDTLVVLHRGGTPKAAAP